MTMVLKRRTRQSSQEREAQDDGTAQVTFATGKMAQRAGKAAPAVVVAGALAGPQVSKLSAAPGAAATRVIQAHLDAAELPARAAAPEHAVLQARAAARPYTVRPGHAGGHRRPVLREPGGLALAVPRQPLADQGP